MSEATELPAITFRDMTADDWPEVARIYADGMATGHATFATTVPAWDAWDSSHVVAPRLVAVMENFGEKVVAGWAALSPVSARAAYSGVAEVSVYVGEGARGRGIGHALLVELVMRSEAAGLWTLQASIFPENVASLSIHARCGFRELGRRERIAQHHGRWRDTVLLERRSLRVGQS
jgi:phosphinothricin acetyltransferase